MKITFKHLFIGLVAVAVFYALIVLADGVAVGYDPAGNPGNQNSPVLDVPSSLSVSNNLILQNVAINSLLGLDGSHNAIAVGNGGGWTISGGVLTISGGGGYPTNAIGATTNLFGVANFTNISSSAGVWINPTNGNINMTGQLNAGTFGPATVNGNAQINGSEIVSGSVTAASFSGIGTATTNTIAFVLPGMDAGSASGGSPFPVSNTVHGVIFHTDAFINVTNVNLRIQTVFATGRITTAIYVYKQDGSGSKLFDCAGIDAGTQAYIHPAWNATGQLAPGNYLWCWAGSNTGIGMIVETIPNTLGTIATQQIPFKYFTGANSASGNGTGYDMPSTVGAMTAETAQIVPVMAIGN